MPNQTKLAQKFESHLLRTVGPKPTEKEMQKVNKELRVEFDKIYNGPNKPLPFLKAIYDKKLSKLWDKRVASESNTSEIILFHRLIRLGPNSTVTSLGSGLAVFELFIANEFVPKGKVYCIDLSKGMGSRALRLRNKLKIKNVEIITASATKIPIQSNSQDLVLARTTGLSNDTRWVHILKEARRIMKKNGRSIFAYTVDADFNKPVSEIKLEFKKANLKFVTIKGFKKGTGTRVYLILAKPST